MKQKMHRLQPYSTAVLFANRKTGYHKKCIVNNSGLNKRLDLCVIKTEEWVAAECQWTYFARSTKLRSFGQTHFVATSLTASPILVDFVDLMTEACGLVELLFLTETSSYRHEHRAIMNFFKSCSLFIYSGQHSFLQDTSWKFLVNFVKYTRSTLELIARIWHQKAVNSLRGNIGFLPLLFK